LRSSGGLDGGDSGLDAVLRGGGEGRRLMLLSADDDDISH
jgi:hypothetical protein